ncbi:MAG: MFS transporter [Neisseriaceae bacterium]|nr:MFS transporter [Neisseriaceae bacterium]MBP6863192.1 MFS transporter [Neisseriaceae bacterium]
MNPQELRASTALAGVYALRMLGMFLILPVFALYAQTMDGGLDPRWVGLAFGAYGLTQALLQLPLGMASDRFGRKRVIYLGLLVFALGSFIAAYADNIYLLALGRAIQGAGAVSAAVTALLADLTRDEVRTRAMAMIGISIGVTFAVSLVLGPLLAGIIGVNGIFALTGVLTLLAIVTVHYMVPNPQVSKVHADAEATVSALPLVLKNTQLLRLNFGVFALHCAQMLLFLSLPLALEGLGLAREQHWYLYLPVVVLGLVLMVPAIIVGEKKGKLKQVFVLAIALMVVAQLGLSFSLHSLLAIFLALMFYFVGFNILEASLPSMISKIAPTHAKGTAIGVFNTTQSLGLFVGASLSGFISQKYGFFGIFTFCTVLMVAWLLLAATAPAPLKVKNVVFTLPAAWANQWPELRAKLIDLSTVVEAECSDDGSVLYLKVLQQGYDADVIQAILSGD